MKELNVKDNGYTPLQKDRDTYFTEKYYQHSLARYRTKVHGGRKKKNGKHRNRQDDHPDLRIRQTGSQTLLATLVNAPEILNRQKCKQLKSQLSLIIHARWEVSIDVRGVKNITREGLRILQDMQQEAEKKKCKLKYIHIDSLLYSSFASLQLEDELAGKELLIVGKGPLM